MKMNFEFCSDVLQFAYPAIVGTADVAPDFVSGNYEKTVDKTIKVIGLILLELSIAMSLKRLTKKPRPSFPNDLESFPSGHMMIAMQCTTRVFFAYKNVIPRTFAVMSSATILLGRYLPGRHDFIDLSAGAVLGVMLGNIWNKVVV